MAQGSVAVVDRDVDGAGDIAVRTEKIPIYPVAAPESAAAIS